MIIKKIIWYIFFLFYSIFILIDMVKDMVRVLYGNGFTDVKD
jgi:hypothetical protein